MKIKIIGSGSIRNKYNSACYLIDDEIMIDFPNGACKYLYKQNIKPSTINHILITHFHGDHYFDIPFYMFDKYKSDNKIVNIYSSKEGKNKIKKLGKLAFPNSFSLMNLNLKIKYNNRNTFKINNYLIEKKHMKHGLMKNTFGYIFKKEKTCVGFTGDTSLCKNILKMAEECTYLFCDCTLLEGDLAHQGIDNIINLTKKYPECTLIASHLGLNTRKELKKLNIKNLIIAIDKKEIEI